LNIYKLHFTSERESLNFCKCEGECKGVDCEWESPGFFITKIKNNKWQGTQKDYWDFMGINLMR
jgi:hypothetical protein